MKTEIIRKYQHEHLSLRFVISSRFLEFFGVREFRNLVVDVHETLITSLDTRLYIFRGLRILYTNKNLFRLNYFHLYNNQKVYRF